MTIARVRNYLARIDRLKLVSGSSTEEILREAFKTLLTEWSDAAGLVFLAEQPIATGRGKGRKPDGTIRHDIRVAHGYWEAKDEDDDLEAEIETKRRLGYPTSNTIFEDGRTAVLYQHGREARRCEMANAEALTALLEAFFAYEPPVIEDWRRAVAQFQTDLPAILEELRARIDKAYDDHPDFAAQAKTFLTHARETVNPNIAEADVREMLIQHILTEEIFGSVFNTGDFHRENNIAKQLYELERLFLRGAEKQAMLRALAPFYSAIKKAALEIDSHAEKQTFLKVVYESFYKTYNPKAADRLGVIYTPNEIVRFMIRGADWLCREHFGKGLIDDGVEILDPATGTGTFICELLEFFRGQTEMYRKYKEELHANEVAILPYYVANLNIEATYAEITGQFAEFPNLVFADTLDMNEGLGIKRGQQMSFLGRFTDENIERIRRQDARKISVVIGNPPYNANQQNENDNNKNREYKHIDDRVKRTFVKLSTAQKTKVYDMYSRFYRWAFDRIADEGIVCFVTNNSFIDARTFDGFRRYVGEEFNECWTINLKGNARTSGERRRREGGNVFDDQIKVGVAVTFLVKNPKREGFKVFYDEVADYAKSPEKIDFLRSPLDQRKMERITPSKRGNWINQVENEWDDLLPVADKKTKAAKVKGQERAIFKLFSLGIVTNRDEWIYDYKKENIQPRVSALCDHFNREHQRWRDEGRPHPLNDFVSRDIKWTSELEACLRKPRKLAFRPKRVQASAYRPFIRKHTYFSKPLTHRPYQNMRVFPLSGFENQTIVFGFEPRASFSSMATDILPNKDFFMPSAAQHIAKFRYTPTGERIDNITDWALNRFTRHYGKSAGVSKDAIFTYVYACLHDPVWRETYAINLRREFPRVPFHADFAKWAAWGERLMDLHINYETVEPWPVTRADVPDERSRNAGVKLPVKLKPHPDEGRIEIDSETTLTGFPPEAWDYKLGNRSGLDWVLDQHKEKKVRDATVEAWLQVNPDCRYRFADHKERVIDLLARVARVSVETLKIVEDLREASVVGKD